MVYTEYFARGTEPTAFCDLHPTRGIMTKLAGLFGGSDEQPAPPRIEDTGIAPPTSDGDRTVPRRHVENPPAPPPKKKRGFWSRLFGRDREAEHSDTQAPPKNETQPPPKKKGG